MAKRFCTGCGTEVTGLFCSKCGKEIDDFQKDKEFLTKQAQERITNESANSGTTNYNPMPTSPYYGSNAEDNLKSFRIVGAGLIIAFAIYYFMVKNILSGK